MGGRDQSNPNVPSWASDDPWESAPCLEIPLVQRALFLTASRGEGWKVGTPVRSGESNSMELRMKASFIIIIIIIISFVFFTIIGLRRVRCTAILIHHDT